MTHTRLTPAPWRRFAVFLAMAGAALFAPGSPSQAADEAKVIYLATAQRNDPANETSATMAAVFKSQVEAATERQVRVELFPDSQLGGNRELASLTQKNIVQSAIVSVGGVAPLYPPIAVIEMPFAYGAVETAYTVLDGPFGQKLGDKIGQASGLTVLGFGDSGGFFVLTHSKHEIRSPQDMDGVRVRSIPGFEVLNAMISGMGGVPVKVSSREEFSALEERMVDGQMNPVPIIVNRRYDSVQQYMTLTNHLYVPYVWVINAAFMESLPLEHRQAVTDAARAAVLAGRARSRDLAASDRGLPAIRKRMDVYDPSAEERAAFKAAAQPKVAQTIAATLGDEGVA